MPNWVRWILVLPAAIGAYLGVQICVGLASDFVELAWIIPDSDVARDWYSQAINSVVGPIALIYAGAFTSPQRYRFHTSVSLAILLAIFTVGVLGIAINSAVQSLTPLWWLITTSVIAVVSVIIACVLIERSGSRDLSRSGD